MNLVSLLVTIIIVILVVGVVLWVTQKLLAAFGIGDPIATVIYVIVVLIALLFVLQSFGILNGGSVLHLR